MYGNLLVSCKIGIGTTYGNIHRQAGLVVSSSQLEEPADAMRQLCQEPNRPDAMVGGHVNVSTRYLPPCGWIKWLC